MDEKTVGVVNEIQRVRQRRTETASLRVKVRVRVRVRVRAATEDRTGEQASRAGGFLDDPDDYEYLSTSGRLAGAD